MSDGEFRLQQAVYNALSGVLSVQVYDHVPEEEPTFPFVVIGETDADDFSDKTDKTLDVTIEIQCFSRYRGFKECKEILGTVYGQLHQGNLTVLGHTADLVLFSSASFIDESDGLTRQGIHRYRVVLTEN